MTYWLFHYTSSHLEQNFFGIQFKNPVGLAAGFDKDIYLPNIIEEVGFGREECWSITYKAYRGNPGTRLYRLKKSKGLVVNYGLKNKGVDYAKQTLERTSCKVPLFVSIAKTNCIETCDFHEGINDYTSSIKELQSLSSVSWFVINISCPNAFGWEDYTTPERLTSLLQSIKKLQVHKPIFVKLPVDKPRTQLESLIHTCIVHHIQWVIISNLTKYREDIIEKDSIRDIPGWISGKPTQEKSDYLIGQAYKTFGKNIMIIWVGGIFSAQDAYHKIRQWASLVQLITGMIYQWPQLIGQINSWIVDLLHKDGFSHISQAIGANHTNSDYNTNSHTKE